MDSIQLKKIYHRSDRDLPTPLTIGNNQHKFVCGKHLIRNGKCILSSAHRVLDSKDTVNNDISNNGDSAIQKFSHSKLSNKSPLLSHIMTEITNGNLCSSHYNSIF